MFRLRPVLGGGHLLAAMEWPEPWSRLAARGWTTHAGRPAEERPSGGPGEGVEELEEFHEKVKECGSTGRIQWKGGRPFQWPGQRLASKGPAGSGGGGRGS